MAHRLVLLAGVTQLALGLAVVWNSAGAIKDLGNLF